MDGVGPFLSNSLGAFSTMGKVFTSVYFHVASMKAPFNGAAQRLKGGKQSWLEKKSYVDEIKNLLHLMGAMLLQGQGRSWNH